MPRGQRDYVPFRLMRYPRRGAAAASDAEATVSVAAAPVAAAALAARGALAQCRHAVIGALVLFYGQPSRCSFAAVGAL